MLLEAIFAQLPSLAAQALVNITWSLAQIGVHDDRLLQALYARTIPCISQYEPKALSQLAWACAKVRTEDKALQVAVASASERQIEYFDARTLAWTAWAFAKLQWREHDALLDRIARLAAGGAADFGTQEISKMVWACATLGIQSDGLLSALSARSQDIMPSFDALAISNTAWAYAKLLHNDEPLLQALSGRALELIPEFGAQELGNLVWSCARLAYDSNDLLLRAVSKAAQSKARSFSPQDLGNTCWAYAAIAAYDKDLFDAVSRAALQKIPAFHAQACSNLAWAFATVRRQDDALLEAFSQSIPSMIDSFTVQGLSNTAWAYARLERRDGRLFQDISLAMVRRLRTGEDALSSQEVSNTLWAFASLRIREEGFLSSFMDAVLDAGIESSAMELSMTMWAVAALSSYTEDFLANTLAAAQGKLEEFSMRDLANTSWAMAELRLGERPLMDALAGQTARMLEASGTSAVASTSGLVTVVGLVRAFAQVEKEPPFFEVASDLLEQHGTDMDRQKPSSAIPQDVDSFPRETTRDCDSPFLLQSQANLSVLWKPPGWTVSAEYDGLDDEVEVSHGKDAVGSSFSSDESSAGGWRQGTFEDWLAKEYGQQCPIALDAGEAHGLLHRLDRDTSGALLWANTYRGYYVARFALAAQRIRKEYVCLCHGWPEPEQLPWLIREPLLKRWEPLRSEVSPRGRPSLTEVRGLGYLEGASADGSRRAEKFCLVEILLHTGRLHQIRAHLASAGHPLVGDEAYAPREIQQPSWIPRMFLHASRLSLDIGSGPIDVSTPLPDDLGSALEHLQPASESGRQLLAKWGSRGAVGT
eukprot:TRINITY_DN18147_c0_g1_i5.p1 TRINITY_DN18147_c0_g1~~TRINITY_DN18147_c0_g1_i5.p1  ORF type:complete len:820 (-),score=133.48 TRINITY_DN18147_c0_g1_i5:775-3234(-)